MASGGSFLRTFKVDATPPVGDYLCGGLHDTSLGVEAPLDLRGIVLSSPAGDFVIAVVDFCYLCGRSYQRLIDALAEGAGVPRENVTLHANHLHDAPLVDEEAHAIVEEFVPGLRIHNEIWFADLLGRVRDAVRGAGPATSLAGTSFSQHAVDRFASTRRVLGDDGECRVRWSICRDADVRDAPEGLIDPMLDMLVLYGDDGRAAVCLSFYASHPQVSDGRRLVSTDTVGVARDLFESTFPGVFHLHFDGCGGDVTAGKYSTANRKRNRLVLGVRLFDAMEEAFRKARPAPCGNVHWSTEFFDVPLSPVDGDEAHFADILRNDDWRSNKYMAATKLLRLREGLDRYPYRMTRLGLGDTGLLFLPAEMCVEYQLYAKRRWSGPLAVAAYGDCFLKYIATDAAFDQGGYEIDPKWTEVGKGIEQILKARMDALLEA